MFTERRPITLLSDFTRAVDPLLLAKDCGITPDLEQAKLLTTQSRKVLVNCTRQWGKSTTTALRAVHDAIYAAPAMVIMISPSQPQSTELFKKAKAFLSKLPDAPATKEENQTRLELVNGSRIISLPGSEDTARGYSGVTLLIVDEAARVSEGLFQAITPMLATTKGQLIALTTPAGKRGWFYELWTHGENFERFSVKAADCPRIPKEVLEDELRDKGPLRFSEEYECAFIDADTAVFGADLIEAALTDEFEPF